jgi:hypothetical protein
MGAWHRLGRFALLTAALLLLGSLPAGRWAEAGPAAGGGKQPQYVLIIRHAEKPKDDRDPHLTSRGAGRAAALPSLFWIKDAFRTKPARFPTPDFLFATCESKHSNRPVETVQPLAKALGDLPIHDKHANDDYQAVVDHVFNDAKFADKTVLICWHHGKIPKLARAVGDKAKNKDKHRARVPPRWDDKVFDRVWQFTFDGQGGAKFADRPQRLLYGDSAK